MVIYYHGQQLYCTSMKEKANHGLVFKVVIEEAAEGGYIAKCPSIPGCHTQGETMDEAIRNIKEAIILCLETMGAMIPAEYQERQIIEVTV